MWNSTGVRCAGLLFCLLSSTTTAHADNFAGRPPGSIGVFADTMGLEWCVTDAYPGVPFYMYVVSFDVEGGMLGYEFSLKPSEDLFILQTSSNLLGEHDVGEGDRNWIVELEQCFPNPGAVWLQRIFVLIFTGKHDTWLCVRPSSPPSSRSSDSPAWLACDRTLHSYSYANDNLGRNPDGCAVFSPFAEPWGRCSVATGEASWGMIKARFHR